MVMKSALGLAVAGLAVTAGLALPSIAAARPTATAPTPKGTIFFSRENAARTLFQNVSMTGSGGSVHVFKGPNERLLPVPRTKRLYYTVNTAPGVFQLDVATYSRKVTHVYKPKGLDAAYAVSPNGKYLGVDLGSGQKDNYDLITTKGKVVAKLFSAPIVTDEVWEAFNPASTQVAVLVRDEDSATPRSALRIYNRHGKLVRTLVRNAGASEFVAWSKGGAIAYGVNHDVKVVKAAGGKPRVLFADSGDFPGFGLAYSPDGRFLAYGIVLPDNSTQIWEAAADGSHRHVVNNDGYFPTWG
jgi:hypothetical protein